MAELNDALLDSGNLRRIISNISVGDYDMSGFENYKETIFINESLPYDDAFLWSPNKWDSQRLPGNISIHEFLIYKGYLFRNWLHDIGYYDYRRVKQYNPDPAIYDPTYDENIPEIRIDDSLKDSGLGNPKPEGTYDPNIEAAEDEDEFYSNDAELADMYVPPYAMINGVHTPINYDSQIEYMREGLYKKYPSDYGANSGEDPDLAGTIKYNDNGEPIPLPVEMPQYSQSYPDTILSASTSGGMPTVDSSHVPFPMTICYRITRREPDSQGKAPFSGRSKMWKERDIGNFTDGETDEIFRLKMKQWETAVEFTILGRSALEAEWLMKLFELFCDSCEGMFLKAGIVKTIMMGESGEREKALDNAGARYRKIHRWYKTQEFKVYGPLARIESIEIETEI